jgi:hypothetical protein
MKQWLFKPLCVVLGLCEFCGHLRSLCRVYLRSGGCGLEYASGSQILRFVISSEDFEISTTSTHKRLDGTVEVVAPLCDTAYER